MIDMTDDIRGIWFVTLPGSGDWMCAVHANGRSFKMQYRFRYYVDHKTFDSKDEKRWYQVEPAADQPLQTGIDLACNMANALATKGEGEKWEVLRGGGSLEDFVSEYTALPFVSVKRAKKNADGTYTDL